MVVMRIGLHETAQPPIRLYAHFQAISPYGWTSPQIKKEYTAIIKDVLTTPEYASLFIVKSGESAVKQFFCFGAGDAPSQQDDSPTFKAISTYFPESVKEFNAHDNMVKPCRIFFQTIFRNIFGFSLLICSVLLLVPSVVGKYKCDTWLFE